MDELIIGVKIETEGTRLTRRDAESLNTKGVATLTIEEDMVLDLIPQFFDDMDNLLYVHFKEPINKKIIEQYFDKDMLIPYIEKIN